MFHRTAVSMPACYSLAPILGARVVIKVRDRAIDTNSVCYSESQPNAVGKSIVLEFRSKGLSGARKGCGTHHTASCDRGQPVGTKIGEGDMVRVVAYVSDARLTGKKRRDGTGGEAVGCKQPCPRLNDIHIDWSAFNVTGMRRHCPRDGPALPSNSVDADESWQAQNKTGVRMTVTCSCTSSMPCRPAIGVGVANARRVKLSAR
jgi:hypothetical protein